MGMRLLACLVMVSSCLAASGQRREHETEINHDWDTCDRMANFTVYIKMKDGSLKLIETVPWDLMCATSPQVTCVYLDGKVIDISPDNIKNLSLVDQSVYGYRSRMTPAFVRLVSFVTKSNHSDFLEKEKNHGCNGTMHPERIPIGEDWMGLMVRGHCPFDSKAINVANQHKASGFALYNYNDPESTLNIMNITSLTNITSVMVNYNTGVNIQYLELFLQRMKENNITDLPYTDQVYVNITYLFTDVDTRPNGCDPDPTEGTPVAVTIVTITFVVVMVLALGWLVIYYFQRHRSVNRQAILQLKLQKAARKALHKIGERNVSEQDDPDDECTYCISPLLVNETIRQLPCGHLFHKGCVEDWLVEKRTCPNCQDNILLATNTTIKGVKDLANAEEEPGTEMTDMANIAPEQRQLLSDSQAIDGHSEGSADAAQQWGSQVIPGGQLLTDGQNMFLFVPDNVELSPDSTIQIDNNLHPQPQHPGQQQSQQDIIASAHDDGVSIEQTM